jgi:hypothetical protein
LEDFFSLLKFPHQVRHLLRQRRMNFGERALNFVGQKYLKLAVIGSYLSLLT